MAFSLPKLWARLRHPRKPLTPRQALGRQYERAARTYLQSAGYVIEATNVRFPVGELDVVALDGDTLCFVEVRSRTTDRFGTAQASITEEKRRHLIRAAQWYLRSRQPVWNGPMRFDVVAINLSAPASAHPELIRNAFSADPEPSSSW